MFWSGNKVVARALGDLYDFQINLIVTAQVAGGQLRMEADTNSPLGPIASDTQTLFNSALAPERVTFRLRAQALATFLANGCRFFLTSTVPITTVSETVLVAPASTYTPPSSPSVLLGGELRVGGVLSGVLEVVEPILLSGGIVGRGVLAGELRQSIDLSGDLVGRATLSGQLQQSVALVGAVTGQGVLTGALSQSVALSGAAVARGLLAGSLTQSVALSGAAVGRGVLAGTLTVAAAEDADAAAYLNAQTTAPSSTERSLVDALVRGLKDDGVWNSLDWLTLLAAETQQAALLNVRKPTKTLTTANTPTFTANRGFTGNGTTSYLDLGEPFATTGNLFVQNSASMGVWANAEGATGSKPHIGNIANSPRSTISARSTSGNETFQANDSSTDTLMVSNLSRLGHRAWSRTAAGVKRGFFNGSRTADLTTASVAVNTSNGSLLRSGTSYADDRLAAFWSAAGLTDAQVTAIHNRLNTYLSAKSAA